MTQLFGQVILCTVLVVSSIGKLTSLREVAVSFRNGADLIFKKKVSPKQGLLLAGGVVVGEMALVIAISQYSRIGFPASAAFFAICTALAFYTSASDISLKCACFGKWSGGLLDKTAGFRNLLLTSVSLAPVFGVSTAERTQFAQTFVGFAVGLTFCSFDSVMIVLRRDASRRGRAQS